MPAAKGRCLPAALVFVLLGLHIFFSLWPAVRTIGNDFANYYVPARVLLEGGRLDRIYERLWLQNEIRRAGIPRLGDFAPNPPPNALLLLPLARLSPPAAKAAWTLVLALAMLAAFLLLRSLVPVSPWLLALVFLLQTSSLSNALLYGPPYPILLLLLCASLWALNRGHPLVAGLVLSPVVALKLYGIPFALHLVWTRRWRAVAGFLSGVVLLALLSLGSLGVPVHAVYAREMLPASLRGELLDPYSPSWQSVSGLAHRLFVAEPDLNPSPAADRPDLARALSRAPSVALLLLPVLVGSPTGDARRLRREWAALTLGSLAASPFTGSYHFVLLALPGAVLVSEAVRSPGAWRVPALLGLLAFAGSPAPHYFAGLASGWGNLLSCPRLAVVLVLFAASLRAIVSRGPALAALGAGALTGLAAMRAPAEEPWTRVAEAHGRVLAEPAACDGGLAWTAVEGERLVVRGPDGRIRRGPADTFSPRCTQGGLVVRQSVAAGSRGEPTEAADQDASADGSVVVRADRGSGSIRETGRSGGADRVLATGIVRYPRLSPDGAWVAYQSWETATRSWDIRAVERSTGRSVRVTADPANEVEPSWMPGGDVLVFASDRRRGLGFTALYTTSFRP